MVRVAKKDAQQAPQGRPTLIDWYQGLMRTIWRKIGIRPEWVHGLDELTTCFMICGYGLSLVMLMMRPSAAKASFSGAPAWASAGEMLCRTDREISANYEYRENGIQFSGRSAVNFILSDPQNKPDVIVAVPRRLSPFDKEGYRVLVGAINQAVCEVQTDVLSYTPERFQTKIAFGFGETVSQIVNAAQQLQPQTGVVIRLLSQRGYKSIIAGDTGYLGKVLCPNCARGGLSGISSLVGMVSSLGMRKRGNDIFEELDAASSKAGPLDVTYQTFTGLKGNELEIGYDAEVAELVLQSVLDQYAAQQLSQIQQIWRQLDKLFANERMVHQIQHAPETLGIAENIVVQAATVFGFNLTFSRGGLLILGYFLVLPLAINLNVWHKRARGRFLRSVYKAFNVRFVVCMAAYAAGSLLMRVGQFIFKDEKAAGRLFDVDNLPKMAASLCLLGYFLTARLSSKSQEESLEGAELSQQRNTAVMLIWYFWAAVRRSPDAIFLAQLIILSHVGYYAVEYMVRRKILCRAWTVNASYVLLYLAIGSAIVLQHLHLEAFRGLEAEESSYRQLLAACWAYSLLLGFAVPILRLVQGKVVAGVFLCIASLFFWRLYFQNPVERVILDGIRKTAKTGVTTPSQAGLNKLKAFCDGKKLSCTLFLESGKRVEVPFVEERLRLFQNRVEVKVALPEAEGSLEQMEVDLDGKAPSVHAGTGEFVKVQAGIIQPVYWRVWLETWLKK